MAENEGSQGNESENALRMANKLLELHAISIFDLKGDTDECGVSFLTIKQPWARQVASSICRLYNCEGIYDTTWETPKFIVVGSDSNRMTAVIVLGQLIDQIKKEKKGAAFNNGAANGLSQVCLKIRKDRKEDKTEIMPGTGLVALDLIKRQEIAVKDWLAKNMPNLVYKKSNRKSSHEGNAYGKSLNPGARVSGNQKMIG